jgi:hypothetical protein
MAFNVFHLHIHAAAQAQCHWYAGGEAGADSCLRLVALHRGLHWAPEFIHGGLELLIFNM